MASLRRGGHGVDAVEKARQWTPDLIVLDLAMPRMNGLEAAPALRSFMPTVALILFTVFGNTPQMT
jgi:CheY-like chemotaxis protein